MADTFLKITAEALVTMYTVVARTSDFSPMVQSAFRTIVIPLAILPFVPFFSSHIFSSRWILAGIVNIIHIISSFEGFRILPTGPAVTIYFTYPLIGVFLSYLFLGRNIGVSSFIGILLAFIGVIILNYNSKEKSLLKKESSVSINMTGIGWIFISAITQALLYLIVISGDNTYDNHYLLIMSLYFWAGILGAIYLFTQVPFYSETSKDGQQPGIFSMSSLYLVIANLVFGVGGMILLHGTARVIPTGQYNALSYIGVLFGYIYGILQGDGLRGKDIIASLIIIFGSFFGGLS